MRIFKKGGQTPDPRDKVGQNPTGRERRSSGRTRRRAARALEADLDGWTPEDDEDEPTS